MVLPDALELPSDVPVMSRTFHTVDQTIEHPENEVYTVSDRQLLETLVGCGFADIVQDPQPK